MKLIRLGVGIVLLLSPLALHAQSLADVAKKAQEQRDAAKKKTDEKAPDGSTPPATKTYTEKDFDKVAEPSTPPAAAATEGATAAPAPASDTSSAGDKKDEAYWKGRMRVLKTQLDVDVTARDAAAKRAADYAKATDASRVDVNGKPMVSRDLQNKSMDSGDELSRIEVSVKADRLAISALEEEARKAGAPPGWLRIP